MKTTFIVITELNIHISKYYFGGCDWLFFLIFPEVKRKEKNVLIRDQEKSAQGFSFW